MEEISDSRRDSDFVIRSSLIQGSRHRESFSLLSLASLARTYYGLKLISSTFLTSISNMHGRSIRLSCTRPGIVIQVGTEVPMVDLRGKLESHAAYNW